MSKKPIKIFFSELGNRFYASDRWKEEGNGVVIITGKKYDVTDDIARLIKHYGISFKPKPNEDIE